MMLRDPRVLIGLALVAIPIAIHLLVRAPARTVDLPSLRFVRSSPMRALRRHLLDDGGLLAVRILILVAAVVALADPLVLAGCRRDAWNARLVRAIVVDTTRDGAPEGDPVDAAPADVTTRIETTDLRDGLRRAQAWLAAAPPGRQEILVSSPFAVGVLDTSTIAEIPPTIGLRFAPRETRAPATTTAGPGWSTETGAALGRLRTTLALEGAVTRVEAGGLEPLALATTEAPDGIVVPALGLRIEVEAAGAAAGVVHPLTAARAALRAVLATGVALDTTAAATARSLAQPITLRVGAAARAGSRLSSPWMAHVVRAITSDADLTSMAASERAVAAGTTAPATLLRDVVGAPLISVTTAASRPVALEVQAHVAPTSQLVPALLRVLVASRSRGADLRAIEPLRIPAAQLTAWTREPAPVDARDVPAAWSDRRWAWALVIAALTLESIWRRRRRGATDADGVEAGTHAA